jgi:ATP-dependent helicase Lhr and Lhr-like helicase
MPTPQILESFSPPTRAWFESSFAEPTPAQAGAWDAIATGEDALVVAPTGSGKTLAAFLWAIDRLATSESVDPKQRLRVLYVSPLKALAVDIERNLRAPLHGIGLAAERLGGSAPDVTVGVRTGDTPQDQRRRFATSPPDILITTPESLFLLLTSQAREALRSVETVIIDEVHAVAATKRGSHLALSLERLDRLTGRRAQRIGLSATVRPVEEVARFLSGAEGARVIAPPSDKELDLKIVVPVEDMGALGEASDEPASGPTAGPEARSSIWPHVDERLLELIREHKSTIVFANSRRLAERLCSRLNDLAEEEIARAHHGSVSREQRMVIEEDLKAGRLRAVVATSSLELGIDMGAVDLVVQVEAPDSVASGMQRVGRAGHHVGAVSRGIFFPKFRGDLVECAVVVQRMREGAIEAISYPRNTLDVLAQQIVAMVAMDEWDVDELQQVVTRSAPFAELPRSALETTLDMLSGRYPSDEFAELRPRINWDRRTNKLTARGNAQRLAVTSGGTIPDRGLFGVYMVGEKGPRVGELDEEMVYESRVGETFILGSSTWMIEDITHDRVVVSPAPGQPGRMPFWHGDALGREVELGKAVGAFVRELDSMEVPAKLELLKGSGLDDYAAMNLIAYLGEQKEATGALPDDRTIVVERFRDELGDWRVCIHSAFGARVNAPWSQAIEARIRENLGLEVQTMYSDDGIVIRLPDAEDLPPARHIFIDPDEIEELVVSEVGGSALFASRFRECAARALLLPKRNPGKRSPLWQQRQKSAQLLQVASRHPTFPVILEALRECLQDVFDLESLTELLAAIQSREIRVVEVDTPYPSPFAGSLQFGYISAFMYEGDAPLAERRAQALTLDRNLLAEIMGRAELRELLDEGSLTSIELELQLLADDRKIRDSDALHDALRRLGDLTTAEVSARSIGTEAAVWLESLESAGRVLEVRIAGEERWIAIEDAARVRDGLGTPMPPGIPFAFLEPVADPLGDLVGRYARTHGPFVARDVSTRLGLGVAVVEDTLARLAVEGRVVEGEFRPGGSGQEWVDVEVLRRLRRRSLAAYRKDVEPVPPEALARFALAWQGVGETRRGGLDALYSVVDQLQGAPLPASALEGQILATRVPGYQPTLLDELCASGEVTWCGGGAIGNRDGWIHLALADDAPALLPLPDRDELSPTAVQIRAALEGRGALFFRQIADETGSTDDTELLLSLWELVWKGHVTNDTLAPLRALLAGTRSAGRGPSRPRRGPALPSRLGPPSAGGRWALVVDRITEPTARLHRVSEQLLSRHGVVTRGAATSEKVTGGYAGVYAVLKAMEESGRCRRGYFVEGLGGAQFAWPGAVDRMRSLVEVPRESVHTHVLAATDPANVYGAALPWPEKAPHRPGRKAGALVVLVAGVLVLYVEKGGRSLLSFTEDEELLRPAVDALALSVRDGALGRLTVEKADGETIFDTPLAHVLESAGFRSSLKGLRLRA